METSPINITDLMAIQKHSLILPLANWDLQHEDNQRKLQPRDPGYPTPEVTLGADT